MYYDDMKAQKKAQLEKMKQSVTEGAMAMANLKEAELEVAIARRALAVEKCENHATAVELSIIDGEPVGDDDVIEAEGLVTRRHGRRHASWIFC